MSAFGDRWVLKMPNRSVNVPLTADVERLPSGNLKVGCVSSRVIQKTGIGGYF